MRDSLTYRCDLLIKNYESIKSVAGWENTIMVKLSAYVFACKNRMVNPDVIRQCKQIIKNSAGVFSNFRGITRLYTISGLALADRPEEKMEQMVNAYNCLKLEFGRSDYMVAAAGILADFVEPAMYEQVVHSARSIYKKLKEEHPFLTGREDITFAVLFALSEKEESVLLREVEECFQNLRKHFYSKNDVQALSFVLALGDSDVSYKCKRTMDLYEQLVKHGCKFGKGNELASLGVLALAEVDIETLVNEIAQVNECLKGKKGFGFWSSSNRERLMFAGMLVMNDYVSERTENQETMKITALNSVVSIIIAQQAATCAAIAAASASASASS